MVAFGKASIIALIKRNSIELYGSIFSSEQKLAFPPNLIQNQEVLDPASLEELVKNFLLKSNIPKHTRIFLILNRDTCYEKIIPTSDHENESFEVEKFIEEIPFDPPNISRLVVRTGHEIVAFAAYKNFFYPFVSIFNTMGYKPQAVMPIAALGVQEGDGSLTPSQVDAILAHSKQNKKYNFLQREEHGSAPRSTKIIVGAVSALVVVTIMVVLTPYISQYLSRANKAGVPAKRTQQITPSPKPSISPVPETMFDKSTATVKVLNGTGREGEASEVQELLTSLGFESIETGNAPQQGQTKTQVTVVSSVPKNVQSDIVALLKKTFAEVDIEQKATAEATVVVTTGGR